MAVDTPYIVEPAQGRPHTHTILFLHGRDSSAREFANELFESEASQPIDIGQPRTLPSLLPTVRWVFPSAPMLHSARFGIAMSQWFDMWSTENPTERGEIQHAGLRSSVDVISQIVREEQKRVDGGRARIFLAGISQGFATVIAVALSMEVISTQEDVGFAGLMGLSSWMPLGDEETLIRALGSSTGVDKLSQTPVFLGHSRDDEVINVENGRALRDVLGSRYQVEWHEYETGGHWLNEPEGIDDLVDFVRRNMQSA